QYFVDLHDERMAHAGRVLGLVEEPLPLLGRQPAVLSDALDSDLPLQLLIPAKEDLAHAAGAEPTQNTIAADPLGFGLSWWHHKVFQTRCLACRGRGKGLPWVTRRLKQSLAGFVRPVARCKLQQGLISSWRKKGKS